MRQVFTQFVFSGLLAKHAIKDMESMGLLHTRSISDDERKDHDLLASIQEQVRGGSIAMQRYYRFLYVFENLIRELINSRLTEEDGEEWFNKRASADMKKKYEQRKNDEEKNNWHVGRNRHPLCYLDFGDLGRLIINHWAIFEDLLPNQSWVSSRLDEAERSRNVIAHNNLLASEEGTRLEMYVRDWIRQVG